MNPREYLRMIQQDIIADIPEEAKVGARNALIVGSEMLSEAIGIKKVVYVKSLADMKTIQDIKTRQFDVIFIDLRTNSGTLGHTKLNEAFVKVRPLLKQGGRIFFYIEEEYKCEGNNYNVGSLAQAFSDQNWLVEEISSMAEEDIPWLDGGRVFKVLRAYQATTPDSLTMPEFRKIKPFGKYSVMEIVSDYVAACTSNVLDRFLEVMARIPIDNKFKPNERLRYTITEDLILPDLYYIGGDETVFTGRPTVGFTGTVTPHEDSVNLTRGLAKSIAQNKWILAACFVPGIDMAAHLGAVDVNGMTVACVPDILAWPYIDSYGYGGGRENEKIDDLIARIPDIVRIITNAGFVSEHAEKQPDTLEKREQRFYKRDRIISGLSTVVIAVEGDKDSGTTDTALRALLQGKIIYLINWEMIVAVDSGNLKKEAFAALKKLKELLADSKLGEFADRIKIFPSIKIRSSDWMTVLQKQIMQELERDLCIISGERKRSPAPIYRLSEAGTQFRALRFNVSVCCLFRESASAMGVDSSTLGGWLVYEDIVTEQDIEDVRKIWVHTPDGLRSENISSLIGSRIVWINTREGLRKLMQVIEKRPELASKFGTKIKMYKWRCKKDAKIKDVYAYTNGIFAGTQNYIVEFGKGHYVLIYQLDKDDSIKQHAVRITKLPEGAEKMDFETAIIEIPAEVKVGAKRSSLKFMFD